MKAIIQEDETGCGIASVANIVNQPYSDVKSKANALGIFAEDKSLFSDTKYVRKLLAEYGIGTSEVETPFVSWESLPNIALLSTKYHEENGTPFWHWVVFKRIGGEPVVFDSAAYLEVNARKDFEAMEPKWYIAVNEI